MERLNFLIMATDRDFEIIAGLMGILSMIVARLMDWYFPSEHHRKLKEEEEKTKRVRKDKEDKEVEEDSNE